jgi:hypothetical protein
MVPWSLKAVSLLAILHWGDRWTKKQQNAGVTQPTSGSLSRQGHAAPVSVRGPLACQRPDRIITIGQDKTKNRLVNLRGREFHRDTILQSFFPVVYPSTPNPPLLVPSHLPLHYDYITMSNSPPPTFTNPNRGIGDIRMRLRVMTTLKLRLRPLPCPLALLMPLAIISW